jgi:hypothetical protein
MGPDWKGNEDVFEAVLADNASPFELGVQTLRIWLEVAETEYARGDREALRDALAVIERTSEELAPLLSLPGVPLDIAAQYLNRARTMLAGWR